MADFAKIIREHGGELSDEAINAIASAIKTAVGNEYVEKERYKAKLTEIDTLKEQTQTAEDNATTAEKWKTKYEALKDDFNTYKQDQAKKETAAAKEKAYKALLKKAGISEKRIDSILRVTDLGKVELDADGNIQDAGKVEKAIKEEWSDFIITTATKGAQTATPPESNGGSHMTKEEIMKIKNTTERQKAIAENLALFQQKG